jgi:hypothetical protein
VVVRRSRVESAASFISTRSAVEIHLTFQESSTDCGQMRSRPRSRLRRMGPKALKSEELGVRSGGAARQNRKRRGLSNLLLTAVSLQMTEYQHHCKGNRSNVRYSLSMQALEEGPRQSRRMD